VKELFQRNYFEELFYFRERSAEYLSNIDGAKRGGFLAYLYLMHNVLHRNKGLTKDSRVSYYIDSWNVRAKILEHDHLTGFIYIKKKHITLTGIYISRCELVQALYAVRRFACARKRKIT